MTVKDMETDDGFREFVLENEERILELLRSGKTKAGSRFGAETEKGKAFAKGVVEAFMSRDVQEHFIRMGIEMLMGVGAFIKALPLPDELAPIVDAVSEQNETLEGIISKQGSGRKPKKKKDDTIQKIEVK
jgi:hypothetical protein